MNKETSPDPRTAFARFVGEIAESFSFNRSIGQIYGLLYVDGVPLSLEEIARTLSMSKGNASINLRTLEAWGAVRPVSVSGSRRDHYEAATDIKVLIQRRVQEGLLKRLDAIEGGLSRMKESLNSADTVARPMKERMQAVEKLCASARKGLRLFPGLSKLLGGL